MHHCEWIQECPVRGDEQGGAGVSVRVHAALPGQAAGRTSSSPYQPLPQDVADCAGYDYNAATDVCRLLRSLDTLQVRY